MQSFDWATALVLADMRNRDAEIRLIALGVIGSRVHVSVFTIRKSITWIISLRRANRKSHTMPRKLDLPSPEEDAATQRGIEQDLDNPELGDEFFRDARSASAVLPADVYVELTVPHRARLDGLAGQVQVMLLVDQDVFERLQATGPGLQDKINEALRSLVKT